MDNQLVALECMKLALTLTNPSVDARDKVVATTTEFLYDAIQRIAAKEIDGGEVKQTRRGRPPKPCAEEV